MNASNWACTRCSKAMSSYDEVGFEGPLNDGEPDLKNEDCGWFFFDWGVWCRECFEKWEKANEIRTTVD